MHIAYGLSNEEITRALAISVETVNEHVQNLLRRLAVPDRTAAAVMAVRAGAASSPCLHFSFAGVRSCCGK